VVNDLVPSGAARRALLRVLDEIVDGPAPGAAQLLNPGDRGLLQSLGTLSAEQASALPLSGGASIAAHVEHLRYGLSRLNRWIAGEQAFESTAYSASWRRTTVSAAEWAERRSALGDELATWRRSLEHPEHLDPEHLDHFVILVGAIVHLAYHFGAIRQIDRSAGGPQASD
jgi:hypothetical protein